MSLMFLTYSMNTRHFRIFFKLSYLDKAHIRYLQDNLTENNCKCARKYLGKTSNRRLNKISTSDVVSKTSLKDVFTTEVF